MEVKRRTVRNLVAKLSSVSEQTRTEVLCELKLISKHDPECEQTAVLAQIAGCEESEEAMRKAGGVRVLGDLLDEGTGASDRIRENAVVALLNLARCGGEKGRKEVKEMGAKVMEGIVDVAENGSAKGKSKAVELMKIIVDGDGSINEVRDFMFNDSFDSSNHSV